jgi:hypothetical protein
MSHTAEMNKSRMQMACEWDSEKELMLDLLGANPNLTGAQAQEYAIAIFDAGNREDFRTMHQLIQEAVYGPGRQSAA